MSVRPHDHVPHPHIAARKAAGPVKAADQHPAATPVARFNTAVGVRVTGAVGTMWCAYAFATLALVSLPGAIRGGVNTLISWVAQTFLQLVLLSVIMVGQKVQSAAGDAQAKATFDDATALLHYADAAARQLAELAATLAQIEAAITPKGDTP